MNTTEASTSRPYGHRAQHLAIALSLTVLISGLGLGIPATAQTGCDVTVPSGGSIQSTIETADPGATICIPPGTYDESVTVDVDGLTLLGTDGTVVTRTLTVAADAVTLEGFEADMTSYFGISVSGSIEALTLEDLTVSAAGFGLWVSGTEAVNGLSITGSVFEDSLIGIYFQNDPNFVDDVSELGSVSDVEITDTQLLDHDRKAIYAETLQDALLEGVLISGIGSDTHGFNNGIDINLKAGDYSDIVIRDTIVEDVREGDPGAPFTDEPAFSAAVAIKARDDPGRYDAHPATLDGVTLENVTIRDSFNGLRVGEPGVDYTAQQAPTNVAMHLGSIVGIEQVGLMNLGQDAVDAAHTWWGSPLGPTFNGTTAGLTGSTIEGAVDFIPFCLEQDCTASGAVHGSPAPHVSAGNGLS